LIAPFVFGFLYKWKKYQYDTMFRTSREKKRAYIYGYDTSQQN